MASNLKRSVKIQEKDGKTKLVRNYTYDASKKRRVITSKSERVVAPAKATTVQPKKQPISFEYKDSTGAKPKLVRTTRAA